MGEFGDVRLQGQRVVPGKLLKSGFAFLYPDIANALQEVIGE